MPMPHFDEVPFRDTEIDPDSGHPTPRDEFPVTDGNSSPPPSVPLTSTPLREGGRSTRSFENYIEAADRHMTSRVKREDKRVLEVLKYVITVGQENKKLSRKYEKILNHSQQCISEKSILEDEMLNGELRLASLEEELKGKKNRIVELEQDNRELNERLARPPIEVFTETKVELVNDYKDASTQDDEVHPYVLEKESLLKEQSLLRLEIESLKKTLDSVQQKNTALETEVKNAKIAEERLLEVLNTNNSEVADIQHRNMCLEEDIKLVLDREMQLKEELSELWKKYTLHEKEMMKLRNEAMIIPSLESEISKLQTENLDQNKMLEVEKAKFSELKVQYDHLKEESSVLRTDAENAIILAKNLEEQNLDIAEREGLYATESIKLRNMEENLRAKDILVKDLQVQISQLKASFETSTTEVMKLKAKTQELESMNDNLAESSVRDNCMIVELKKRQMEFEIELAKTRENLRNEQAAREDAEGIAKHIPSKDQEISEQNQRILDLTAANEKMSFEIDFMRKELSLRGSSDDIKKVYERLSECEVLLDAITKERDNLLVKEIESHKKLTKMDSMQNDLLIRDQQIEELRKNIDTHKQETVSKAQEIEGMRREYEHLGDSYTALRTEYDIYQINAEQQYHAMVTNYNNRMAAMLSRLSQLETYPGQHVSSVDLAVNHSLYDLPTVFKEEIDKLRKDKQESAEVSDTMKMQRQDVAVQDIHKDLTLIETVRTSTPFDALINCFQTADVGSCDRLNQIRNLVVDLLLELNKEYTQNKCVVTVENFFKHFRDIDKNLISSYENNITEIRRKLNEAVEKHREEIRTKQHSLVDSENKAESLGNSLEKAMVRIKDLQSNLDTLSKDFVKASRDCDGYATAAIAWKKFAEELEDALREANDEAENLNVRLVEAQAVTESEKRRRIALKEELDKIEIQLEKEADQRKNMATQILKLEDEREIADKKKKYNERTMALMSKSFRQMEEIVERLKRRNYERQKLINGVKVEIARIMDCGHIPPQISRLITKIHSKAGVWDVADAHDTVEMDKIQAEHHKKMDIMLAKTSQSQSSVQQLEIGTGSDD